MSKWFIEQRMIWIKESVEIFGVVRREHVMKKFGISIAQASHDLRDVQLRWPELVTYDRSEKIYKSTV
jgi:hypothetical protein